MIRSGVDAEHFRPRDAGGRAAARATLGISAETRLVLFVGNLEPRKQVDVLLRAMVPVRAEVPDAALIVVGSGESAGVQDQTARLVRLTHDLGLAPEDAVRFVGRVEDEQLLDYYAAADVFALPSSSEAQGLVALEAMACGLPVVATAVGGLLGTIEDGRTGFLVPPGEVAALAERLLALLLDEPQRQAMSTAARHIVEREFSWTRAIEATLEVYREVRECPSVCWLFRWARRRGTTVERRSSGSSVARRLPGWIEIGFADRSRPWRRYCASGTAAVLVAPDLRQPAAAVDDPGPRPDTGQSTGESICEGTVRRLVWAGTWREISCPWHAICSRAPSPWPRQARVARSTC